MHPRTSPESLQCVEPLVGWALTQKATHRGGRGRKTGCGCTDRYSGRFRREKMLQGQPSSAVRLQARAREYWQRYASTPLAGAIAGASPDATPWGKLLLGFEQQLLRQCDEEDFRLAGQGAWRLNYGGRFSDRTLIDALLDLDHPLGKLHAQLLTAFEKQCESSSFDQPEVATKVCHLLSALQEAALLVTAPVAPRSGPLDDQLRHAVLGCVERAAFRPVQHEHRRLTPTLPQAPLPPTAARRWSGFDGVYERWDAVWRDGSPPPPPPPEIEMTAHAVSVVEEDEGESKAARALDDGLAPHLYYHAFASVAAQMHEKDRSFQLRQLELRALGQEGVHTHPEDPDDEAPDRAEAAAVEALKLLRRSAPPTLKLECVCAAVCSLASVGEGRWGADEVLSMLTIAMLRSELRAPHAEAAFITVFSHEGIDLAGASGYCLACFEAAAEAASTLTLDGILQPASGTPPIPDAHVSNDVQLPPTLSVQPMPSASLAAPTQPSPVTPAPAPAPGASIKEGRLLPLQPAGATTADGDGVGAHATGTGRDVEFHAGNDDDNDPLPESRPAASTARSDGAVLVSGWEHLVQWMVGDKDFTAEARRAVRLSHHPHLADPQKRHVTAPEVQEVDATSLVTSGSTSYEL